MSIDMKDSMEQRNGQPTTGAPATPPSESADDAHTYAWRNGKLFRSCRPFPWRDGEDFADVRQRNGFYKHAMIELGEEFESVQLKIFSRPGDSAEGPKWLADLTLGDISYLTWIDEVADLLDLLEHLAPTIASVAALSDRAERLQKEAEERKAEARERGIWGNP